MLETYRKLAHNSEREMRLSNSTTGVTDEEVDLNNKIVASLLGIVDVRKIIVPEVPRVDGEVIGGGDLLRFNFGIEDAFKEDNVKEIANSLYSTIRLKRRETDVKRIKENEKKKTKIYLYTINIEKVYNCPNFAIKVRYLKK